jgi:general secretion pathway protein B
VSFILDALRKSESERQRLGGTSIADLPLGRRRAQPWWIVGIAILLLANFIMLAVVMLRPSVETDAEPVAASSTPTQPAATGAARARTSSPATSPTPSIEPSLAPSLAEDALSTEVEYETVDRAVMEAASAVPEGPTLVRSASEVATEANLPPDSLPPLRLDMHVYSPKRDGRFVFINMRKYFEGQAIQEGPTVQHITEGGVILSYQSKRWELDRP